MARIDIDLSSVVVHNEQHVSAQLEDEVVLLNLNDSCYYGLDEIGAFIWSRMAQPCRINVIVDALLESYDVDRENCEADVLAFLRKLGNAGLVRVVA